MPRIIKTGKSLDDEDGGALANTEPPLQLRRSFIQGSSD